MGDATEDMQQASKLPEGDVIRILLEQHARISTLFTDVHEAIGTARASIFAELRAMLVVHETAEQLVLRPESKKVAGKDVADARVEEEVEATKVLADLEKMDVNSAEFHAKLTEFQKSVDAHAEAEENDEFPAILAGCTAEERQSMGRLLLATEELAPTRPHPTTAGHTVATVLTLPLAAIVDRTKDAISKAG
ncbi:MAG TPA: hemerythrin domain-containing protein [Nocardioides sp.]|nr:hemerythrin domain-containing protein [Nocardioides sp.]